MKEEKKKKVYVVIIQVKWSVQVIHDMKIGPSVYVYV